MQLLWIANTPAPYINGPEVFSIDVLCIVELHVLLSTIWNAFMCSCKVPDIFVRFLPNLDYVVRFFQESRRHPKILGAMYVCTYACVYVCMYIRMYLCVYVCICMYICICMYACMFVCMYVCVYVCMCVCMYVLPARDKHHSVTSYLLLRIYE